MRKNYFCGLGWGPILFKVKKTFSKEQCRGQIIPSKFAEFYLQESQLHPRPFSARSRIVRSGSTAVQISLYSRHVCLMARRNGFSGLSIVRSSAFHPRIWSCAHGTPDMRVPRGGDVVVMVQQLCVVSQLYQARTERSLPLAAAACSEPANEASMVIPPQVTSNWRIVPCKYKRCLLENPSLRDWIIVLLQPTEELVDRWKKEADWSNADVSTSLVLRDIVCPAKRITLTTPQDCQTWIVTNAWSNTLVCNAVFSCLEQFKALPILGLFIIII